MLFKENQLEIIDCGLFVPYSCSWRMNFYEIMFLVFKGYTYHIHQRVNLHNFSRDDTPFTENKGTGLPGEGVLLKITVEVCSMLLERLTLPQTKIRDLPCLTSAFRRRVIERNNIFKSLVSRRKSFLCFTPKRGQQPYPLQSKPCILTVYSLY